MPLSNTNTMKTVGSMFNSISDDGHNTKLPPTNLKLQITEEITANFKGAALKDMSCTGKVLAVTAGPVTGNDDEGYELHISQL